MILYHGTNVEFHEIDLTKSNRYKDFEQGFYLTDIRQQAVELSQKRAVRDGSIVSRSFCTSSNRPLSYIAHCSNPSLFCSSQKDGAVCVTTVSILYKLVISDNKSLLKTGASSCQ